MVAYRDGDAWLALADGTRRAIVERLARGPAAVGELARDLPVSRPAVSQHLKVLKCAGLVRDRAAGTRRVYQLDPTGLEALRADLDRFWTRALAGSAQTVEGIRSKISEVDVRCTAESDERTRVDPEHRRLDRYAHLLRAGARK